MQDDLPVSLIEDDFIRRVIHRKVGRLIATSGFTEQDRQDIVQEVYARVTKSLASYDSAVGHLYPYICTIVQRQIANILRDRKVAKRSSKRRVSLSQFVRREDGQDVELAQLLDPKDQDRRLGRERRLDETELSSLRIDLEAAISRLPIELQDLLDRRKTQSIAEISKALDIPRSTLNDWMIEIRRHFEKEGLDGYLET